MEGIWLTKMDIKGLKIFDPTVNGDDRGFLVETFRQTNINKKFVQHNHSRSEKGVLRGLHFQSSPGQAKLVRCSRGKIFDVAVDLRKQSPTFSQWFGIILDDEKHRQLFIPEGFAHGFYVMSDIADVSYLLSTYYDAEKEKSIFWDDPDIGIIWPTGDKKVSYRDEKAPMLSEIKGGLDID
jgi:dTDP-4-dehydrorhamnose 3,5-epimerase